MNSLLNDFTHKFLCVTQYRTVRSLQNSVVTFADCQGHDKDFTLAVRCFCGLSRSRFSIVHDSHRMSFRTAVYETQCCSRDIENGQWGQMGGSPKALATASGRGNQPAEGPPESNRGCPGPRNIRNEPSFWISSRRRLPPNWTSSPWRFQALSLLATAATRSSGSK